MKAIIFDLDNCLSAPQEVGDIFQPVFDAIRVANHGTLSADALEQALSDLWRYPLDWVADTHGFSPAMRAAAWKTYVRVEVTCAMQGFPDLHLIEHLPGRKFLVTTGFRRLQESKIRALGIADRFDGMYVDAIDEPERKGKLGLFRDILRDHRLHPAEALVVGDNPDSEIAAGNRLGIPTVQTLRPGVPRGDTATHVVHGLIELFDILGLPRPNGSG